MRRLIGGFKVMGDLVEGLTDSRVVPAHCRCLQPVRSMGLSPQYIDLLQR